MPLKFRKETKFKETETWSVPNDWNVKTIAEIGEIGGGTTPSTKVKKYWKGDIPWITPKDLATHDYRFINRGERNIKEIAVKDNSLKMYPAGTILLTSRAPIGYVAIAKNQVTTNQGFKNIIPEDANSEYLYYVLLNIADYLKDIAGGSTFGELTKELLKVVQIPYPHPQEQQKIATVLSWFDDLIQNKKKQNEILEKTAMALFKSWFVDFEPFQNEKFVDSELGKIPKGWEVKKLGDAVDTQYGYTASSENEGNIRLLRIMDINKTFVIDWDSVPYCKIEDKEFTKYKLNNLDLVISRIADVGKVAIVENPPAAIFASYLIRLKVKDSKDILPYFLYYWLKSDIYQGYIVNAGEGSTRQNTNARVIKEGPLLLPPRHYIEKFSKIVEPLRNKIILNQKEIMVLRKVRDTLLPLLVFGKLRVEEV